MNSNSYLKFDLYFKILIILIVFLLVEGSYYFYYYKISQIFSFLENRQQSGFNQIIWNENGFVEFLQVVLLLMSLVLIIKFNKKKFNLLESQFKILNILYLFGVIYYLLEEISWGQHIFNWNTPDFFIEINDQNETNFHNSSGIFNQLPRNLLLIWCSLSFLIVKIINTKNSYLNFFIFPSEKLKLISILILIFVVPDIIVDKLNIAPGHPAKNSNEIILNNIYEIITFNFIKLSELHELLFNSYILGHSYFLFKYSNNNK